MRKLPLPEVSVNPVDALDFDAVFADDAGPGLHGVERAGGAGGVFDEEEGDGLAVRRPGGLVDVAGDVGKLPDFSCGFSPEVDLRLARNGGVLGLGGAGAEEGEGRAVGRPDGAGVSAAGRASDGDGLVVGRGRDGSEVEGRAVAGAERPGEGGTVGREGDAAGRVHGVHAALGMGHRGRWNAGKD